MSLGTSNRDGGKTSESGHLRALGKTVSGDVMEGLATSQRAAGVNMSVDISVGDAFVRRSDGSYAHPVFNDAVYNQVISAADGSNPRRDLGVIYIDYGQTPSTAVSNNTNGVVKIKMVTGSPAGSPVDPSGAAIQSSVGSGNPYTILFRVRVPAGQTSISNSLIDDLRTMISNNANSVNTAAIQDSSVTVGKLAVLPYELAVTASVATDESTSSTTYVGLTTPLSVTATVPRSGKVLVILAAGAYNGAGRKNMSVALSGANTVAGDDALSIDSAQTTFLASQSRSFLMTGLTPGSTVFTTVYKVSTGTGNFFSRSITVIPL